MATSCSPRVCLPPGPTDASSQPAAHAGDCSQVPARRQGGPSQESDGSCVAVPVVRVTLSLVPLASFEINSVSPRWWLLCVTPRANPGLPGRGGPSRGGRRGLAASSPLGKLTPRLPVLCGSPAPLPKL